MMRRTRLPCSLAAILATVACPAPAAAAPRSDPRQETVERILSESLVRGRAHELLQDLCVTAPKRLSCTSGNALAVEWARKKMEDLGFENVRLEEVTGVPCWQRGGTASLAVLEPADSRALHLPVLALGGSVGTGVDGVAGELVVVESFDELRALGDKARGSVVLFNRAMDPGLLDPFEAYGGAVDQRSRGAVAAARAGAVAAIVRSMTTRIDDHPHTGALRYQDGVERVPAAAVSTAGAERLAALARSGARPRLKLVLDCRLHADGTAQNVVGELVGSSAPEEVVLVGAHLDAWDVGQGAHDDGAGCAQTLEALRLLRSLELRPKRTLRAVLYANEESGLRGGVGYRERHLDALGKHVLAIESDRGGFTPRGFETDAGPDALALLRPISALFEPIGATVLREGGHGGADISPLAKDGVVLMGYLPDPQRYFDYHHCARDTVDAVHPRELELGAGVIAAMAWCVADLAQPLPRNPKKP